MTALRIDYYYNSDFLDFWLYKVAAFLDQRAFYVLTPAQWPSVFEHMKSLCLDEEIFSPYQLHEREEAERHSGQQRNTRRRLFNLLGALQKKRLLQLFRAVLHNILK